MEKGAIHYIRHNFWPLRTFRDLTDLQAQANQWRDQVANVRVHTTTGQPPIQRFDPKAMRRLTGVVTGLPRYGPSQGPYRFLHSF